MPLCPVRRIIGLWLIPAVLILIAGAGPAWAHKVYVFAWAEGDKVFTDSYFSKSQKVKNGKVNVYGPDGALLVEGTTDDNGSYAFVPPQKVDLRIEIEAGTGHRGEYILTADELPASAGAAEPAPTQTETPAQTESTEEVKAAAEKTAAVAAVDPQMLKTIVNEALDQKIRPLERAIADLRKEQGPGITEIFGGIGYIIGLMGLALYFKRPKG
jgi:nickel transport protein